MDRQSIIRLKAEFDEIARHTEEGTEFWYARELQTVLGYVKWDKFLNVIERAKASCIATQNDASDHFLQVGKMVVVGSGAPRDIMDYMLTRYACYLVAQNGDPQKKEEIAFAQSYFALQTRKQELIEDRIHSLARIEARDRLRESEKRLSQNIYERGVDDKGFGRIRSKGDAALFGITIAQMKDRLGMSYDKRSLADFLPTVTIAAKNLAAR